MKPGNLIVRADGNASIGYGHLMRSLALAEAWQALGGTSILATSVSEQSLPPRVQSSDIARAWVPAAHPDRDDVPFMKSLLRDSGDAWLCCDGYHFDAEYTAALADAARGIVVIDDIAHAPLYRANVIVNQNIFAERLGYVCDPDTTKLLGPAYALIRREFTEWANRRRETRDRATHLLVTMGGGDPDNQTLKVIQALRKIASPGLQVKVIVGGSNPHTEALEREVSRGSYPPIELLRNPGDLPSLMAWADMAISAGGSTCWELCFMGVPSILITLADNQAGITAGLAEATAAVHVGPFGSVSEDLLARTITALIDDRERRDQLSATARRLVDGLGATRVCRVLASKFG